MALKSNVAANFLGQAWRGLLGFVFIPVYIRYLGVEAYGLVSLFAVLLAWLGLLDLGLRPTLNREMARFAGGELTAGHVRDLLRSVEVAGIITALVVFLGVWASSGWLARHWLNTRTLPDTTVINSLTIMGAVAALAFIESIYISSIIGLQRQVQQNAASAAVSGIRNIGVIGVLALVSPTIEAYFVWQAVTSVISILMMRYLVYRALPPIDCPARFSLGALQGIWRFARGMIGITLLSLMLTQIDKTILSKLLALDEFAHYAIAGTVTAALYMLVTPVTTAFYPRMTQLHARTDTQALATTYHQGAQLLSVLLGSAAVTLIFFADRILLAWTGDINLTAHVAPILRILAAGTLLHGMMFMPYHLQLAHGWTSLALTINMIAVVILVPAILLVVPVYGSIGAAAIWLMLNLGYVTFSIYFMHRKILPDEKWRWYRDDVLLPLSCAAAVALAAMSIMPQSNGRMSGIAIIAIAGLSILAAAALGASTVRRAAYKFLITSQCRAGQVPHRFSCGPK